MVATFDSAMYDFNSKFVFKNEKNFVVNFNLTADWNRTCVHKCLIPVDWVSTAIFLFCQKNLGSYGSMRPGFCTWKWIKINLCVSVKNEILKIKQLLNLDFFCSLLCLFVWNRSVVRLYILIVCFMSQNSNLTTIVRKKVIQYVQAENQPQFI